jgi:hypothetical protein
MVVLQDLTDRNSGVALPSDHGPKAGSAKLADVWGKAGCGLGLVPYEGPAGRIAGSSCSKNPPYVTYRSSGTTSMDSVGPPGWEQANPVCVVHFAAVE